ncbi:hypothetical protein AMTR_s00182p00040480 [Amborella trichopoda]|uniref:Uncharacterized protein n=1 Tax=Amborella trichopoda TaxID=13333 RepID=U5D267_AMBTC|nr:hypothetical protein AMTR_s00182p00040480 [Amborella trichopoda]
MAAPWRNWQYFIGRNHCPRTSFEKDNWHHHDPTKVAPSSQSKNDQNEVSQNNNASDSSIVYAKWHRPKSLKP